MSGTDKMIPKSIEECETQYQKVYNDIKIKFDPKMVLTVTVLRCRHVSVSYINDKIDVPDPRVRVCVPSLPEPNLFYTTTKLNTSTAEFNESFKFVFPPNYEVRDCEVEATLYDVDVIYDDCLGKAKFGISDLSEDETHYKTLTFGKHGEVDLEIKLTQRTSPEFRQSFGLSEKETRFRCKRFPIVNQTIRKMLGDHVFSNEWETPTIGLCTTGGGYRALIGMSGAMEAFKDHGLLDVFTYVAALSGSAWYLESAYVNQGMGPKEQEGYHKFLQAATKRNFTHEFFTLSSLREFRVHSDIKKRHEQPITFSDMFGFVAGNILLENKHLDVRQSDLQSYIETAEVPLPIVVSLHVKNNQLAADFHAYMETSPYEVSFPAYGISMDPKCWGSVWNGGFVVRECPELPIHYHMGVTGSAFAILNTTNIEAGEKDSHFVKFVDELRVQRRTNKNRHSDTNPIDSDDSDDSSHSDEDEDTTRTHHEFHRLKGADMKSIESSVDAEPQSKSGSGFVQRLKDTFVTSRNSVFGRTARIFNFSRNLDNPEVRHLDPFGGTEYVGPNKQELMKMFKTKKRRKMTTTKNIISLVDAGLYNNVPCTILLRPQRAVDFMIVLDFGSQPSDTDYNCIDLFWSAAECWREGLKFPPVDIQKISNSPPSDCYVFEDDDDDECPIVVWLTLCNAEFKKLENYVPRKGFKYDNTNTTHHRHHHHQHKKFNDFPVYDHGSAYLTTHFGDYSDLEFQQLQDLMYFNVTKNIEVIRSAILRAVEKRKKRIARLTSNQNNPTSS